MSLGFAFIRPQGLQKSPGQDAFRAFELVGDFMDSLVKDPEGARAVGMALADAGKDLLPHFLLTRQEKLRLADGKIRLLFRPFADLLREFMGGMKGGIAGTLPAALKGLKGLTALLQGDSATRFLREFIHLGQTDLDITPAAIEELFRAFIDGAVMRLQAKVIAGDLSEEALGHYEWGVHLKSLELLILEELDWPNLDLDVLVDALKDLYQRTGFDELLKKIGRVLDAAESVADPLGKVLESILRPAGATGGSVGAAAAGPGAGAPVSASDPLSHYASWVLQKNVKAAIDGNTTVIAPIPWITYKLIKPNDMEQLALHTAWITDFARMLLHIISIEKGDMASNLLNMFWEAGDLLATVTGNRIPNWVQWVITPVVTVLGSFENMRCSGGDDAMYPITLLLGDGGEVMLYKRWTWLFRESLLSFLTLLNHDPDVTQRWVAAGSPSEVSLLRGTETETWPVAFNKNQFHGTCYVFGEIGTLLLPAILSKTDRINYGFIGGGPTGHMVGRAFGGMAISWSMNYCSLFLARLAAGEFPSDTAGMILLPLRERYFEMPRDKDAAIAVRTIHGILVGGLFEWAMQVIYLYLFTNGNTSGGKFSCQDRIEADFVGYSDTPDKSPYKLPWAGGNKQECVQNPMGIWSHYPDDGQAYAYDYNHDAGTEVVCSRTGIIVGMEQTKLNNNPNDWNFMEVMALRTFPAGTANAMPGVAFPAAVTKYADGTTNVEAGTLFPPYWDVLGNTWPTLPSTMLLHPSGAILPAGSTLTGGMAAGTLFSFTDPDFDRGFAAVTYPADSKFSDGTTPIPAGVVFAPDAPRPPTLVTPMYRAGTTFVPLRNNFASVPFSTAAAAGTPGFTPAAGATFLDGVAIPAGLILPPDCSGTPAWLPKPHPATPLYLAGTTFTPITNADFVNAGTGFVAVGTTFPPLPATGDINHQWCTPLVFTFCEYGHAISGYSSLQKFTFVKGTPEVPAVPEIPATPGDPTATPPVPPTALVPAVPRVPAVPGIVRPLVPPETRVVIPGTPREDLTDVFGTEKNSEILGRKVDQGRVIMLSGDTGVSAYNHLHTHVSPIASGRQYVTRAPGATSSYVFFFTIPFVYADVIHNADHGFREGFARNGVPRAMTWYDSQNNRTGP